MGNFTKFSDWEKSKYSSVQEDAVKQEKNSSEESAELLAQIADLVAQRKAHIKNKEDFEAQILEIDIKILKLEVEKNELKEKRKQLTGAKEIADNRRKEGKTHEQE